MDSRFNPKGVNVLFNGIPVEGFAEDTCISIGEKMSYTIYGKENCPFCKSAKELLTTKALPFTYLTLGVDYTREELIEKCAPVIPRTVPQIFDTHGNYIGGFTELQANLTIQEGETNEQEDPA